MDPVFQRGERMCGGIGPYYPSLHSHSPTHPVHSREGGNPVLLIFAKSVQENSQRICCHLRDNWVPAFAGMNGGSGEASGYVGLGETSQRQVPMLLPRVF